MPSSIALLKKRPSCGLPVRISATICALYLRRVAPSLFRSRARDSTASTREAVTLPARASAHSALPWGTSMIFTT
jgi:hypothetical protein